MKQGISVLIIVGLIACAMCMSVPGSPVEEVEEVADAVDTKVLRDDVEMLFPSNGDDAFLRFKNKTQFLAWKQKIKKWAKNY